jgi:hypothetical protein
LLITGRGVLERLHGLGLEVVEILSDYVLADIELQLIFEESGKEATE